MPNASISYWEKILKKAIRPRPVSPGAQLNRQEAVYNKAKTWLAQSDTKIQTLENQLATETDPYNKERLSRDIGNEKARANSYRAVANKYKPDYGADPSQYKKFDYKFAPMGPGPSQQVGPGAFSPADKIRGVGYPQKPGRFHRSNGVTVLQTALNNLTTMSNNIGVKWPETFSNEEQKNAIKALTSPLREYAFNSKQLKLSGKVDADTKTQARYAGDLRDKLEQAQTLWDAKFIDALGGRAKAWRIAKSVITGLKSASGNLEGVELVGGANASVVGAAINRTVNAVQSAYMSLGMMQKTVEPEKITLEEEKKEAPKRELTESEMRWARHFARERINAVVTRKDLAPADAAQVMMSQKVRDAINKEYGKIADILRNQEKRSRLIGTTTDTADERKLKMDTYKQTGKLAHINYENITKLSIKYYNLAKAS